MIHPTSSAASPATAKATCCIPLFRRVKKKRVKFVLSPDNPFVSPRRGEKTRRRSPGKTTFYTALSHMRQSTPSTVSLEENCPCQFLAHRVFDCTMPLLIPPCVEPSSGEELRLHAGMICGRWITVMERSDSLDPQMQYVGIGRIKRMIMNKLVIPLGAELVDNDETLRVWIETPLGNKATHASLVGAETFDCDSDLGDWSAKSYMTDYRYPKFCNGREFRALQMERRNPRLGLAYETKAVLPDTEYGRILLYSISIHPVDNGKVITVNRVYKPQ